MYSFPHYIVLLKPFIEMQNKNGFNNFPHYIVLLKPRVFYILNIVLIIIYIFNIFVKLKSCINTLLSI